MRLRFVISHSLVAGQLYSIFPVIKHRDGHPGITFSPRIQGQAVVPRHSHHHQSVYVACLLTHLHAHPLRLYPADLAKGLIAVLGFQARVLQACHHPLCCTSCNLPCSLKSRDESGSSSDITSISFATSLAPCLWDGCHPSFLALLGEPGSSRDSISSFASSCQLAYYR